MDDPDAPDRGLGEPPLVDLGALERQGPCPADVTGDGLVNVDDLVEVVLNWGAGGGPADVNGDGVVDVDDLVLVVLGWGACG